MQINKKFMNSEKQTRLLLLAALFVSSLFIFRRYLFGNEIMAFNDIGGDTMQLYTMQYASVINHLREGNFSFWDFTNGFGINYFNLNPGDPSFLLLVGIGVILGPDHMLFFLAWVQVLKILLAGYVFYHYLSCFSFSRQAKFAAAFAYGLNGHLLIWGQHYQFGMAIIYFPLMLLGCEKFIQNKKGKALFPLAVFLSGIYSAYFSYMCLAALGIYLLFRIGMEREITWKQRISKFLKGCWRIILGIGMSMGMFLPLASCLLNVSARVGTGNRGILESLKHYMTFYPGKFYESLLMRMFSSNIQTTMALKDGNFEVLWNYYEDPIVFCSTLAVLLNILFLAVFWKSQETKRTKIAVYAAAILIVLCVTTEIGGFVFNGFSDTTNRYTFVLIPFFLWAMAWMWDYIKSGERIPFLFVAGFCIVMVFVYYVGYRQSIFPEHRINAVILCITGLCMAVVIGFGIKGKTMNVLLLLLMINVISEGNACYEARLCIRKTDTPAEKIQEEQARYEIERNSGDPLREARAELMLPQGYFGALYNPNIQDALSYLREKDPEFFRLEKDFVSATWCMDAQAQGYYGVNSYNSVMNKNIKEFVDTCCPELYFADHNHHSFVSSVQNNGLASFLGIRYLLSRDGNFNPEKYKKVHQFGDLYLYENRKQTDMGKFYENTISEESFKKLCTKETRQKLWDNVIAIEDGEEIQSLSDLKDVQTKKEKSRVILNRPLNDSHIEGTIEAATDGYAVFMIPYEAGWHIKIDGKETELIRGNLGFSACSVKEGNHTVTLSFFPPGLREGILLSVLFWCVFAGQQIYEHEKEKKKRAENA